MAVRTQQQMTEFVGYDAAKNYRDLSGHPKTGQRWSGQNRPTKEAGD
jgi:hypothetical protein